MKRLIIIVILILFVSNCRSNTELIRVKDKNLRRLCTELYQTKKEIADCIADRYTLFMDILNGTNKEVSLIKKERLDLYTIIETYEICYSNKRFCEYIEVPKNEKHFIIKAAEIGLYIFIGYIIKGGI